MRTAVTTGFKRSLGAILDGNITTIIGALVLIIVGASTIKSFGITLLIGIILSLISSLVLMRVVLRCILVFNDESKAKRFALKRAEEEVEEEIDEDQDQDISSVEKNMKNIDKGGVLR